jgi:hypothetical protein
VKACHTYCCALEAFTAAVLLDLAFSTVPLPPKQAFSQQYLFMSLLNFHPIFRASWPYENMLGVLLTMPLLEWY